MQKLIASFSLIVVMATVLPNIGNSHHQRTTPRHKPRYTPTVPFVPQIPQPANPLSGDALDEVNRLRVARGLQPFIRDADMSRAAELCCKHRAEHRISGHTRNDFQFDESHTARGAGCAAWKVSSGKCGWGACFTYDRHYTHAGAWAEVGRDNVRYMHLFVKP